jgi:hypothetical protein
MDREAGDADARAGNHGAAVGGERVLEVVQHLAGRQLRAIDVGGRQQHRELVAAQTRNRVGGAQRAPQPRRHLLQHLIAGMMAVGVVDLLEAVQIDHEQRQPLFIAGRSQNGLLEAIVQQRAIGQVGEQIVVGQVGDALVGEVPLAPHRGVSQLALDRRRQPREVALDDVVLGAGPHRRHGRLFADRARDEDERHVEVAVANQVQRLGAAEPRHGVVGDHDVPLRLIELAAQAVGGLDPNREDVITGAGQLSGDQYRVVLPVFDLQQAQRRHDLQTKLRIRRGKIRTPGHAGVNHQKAEDLDGQIDEVMAGAVP